MSCLDIAGLLARCCVIQSSIRDFWSDLTSGGATAEARLAARLRSWCSRLDPACDRFKCRSAHPACALSRVSHTLGGRARSACHDPSPRVRRALGSDQGQVLGETTGTGKHSRGRAPHRPSLRPPALSPDRSRARAALARCGRSAHAPAANLSGYCLPGPTLLHSGHISPPEFWWCSPPSVPQRRCPLS
jgi:hypothetical protein